MKVKDGIIGLIVGDALGVPVEFVSRHELRKDPVTKMEGHGTHNQVPGTWSDDSSMTIATMTSIINKKAIDYEDIMNEFCKWLFEKEHTPHGKIFDSGITTRTALERYRCNNIPALESGCSGEKSNGNGSLMRILPLAFIPDIDYETVENVSALTHAHKRSKIACALYVEIAKSMIENDLSMIKHILNSCDKIKEYYHGERELAHFENIFNLDFAEKLSSSGYVISTFESVIYCLLTTDNYADAVLKAVNLGSDTDTVAAICGGLAGIYYGYDSIPVDWVCELARVDDLLSLCENFEEALDEYF